MREFMRGIYRIPNFRRVLDLLKADEQVGRFLLPNAGEKAEYNSDGELYWHIGEEDVRVRFCVNSS